MAVKLIEVPQVKLDKTQSHIRVERVRSGGFAATGAIGHPDLIEMTHVHPRSFRGREQAIMAAIELAEHFGLKEVLLME